MKNMSLVGLIVVLLVPVQFATAFSMFGTLMDPVIVTLSDDPLISETTRYLADCLENVIVINVDNAKELRVITTRSLNSVFYVGHGTNEGIHSRSSVIEWQDMEDAISESRSLEHMVLACSSSNIDIEDEHKTWITFPGSIDAKVAADIVLALHFLKEGMTEKSLLHSQLALMGYFTKVVFKTEEASYLRPIYDDGGGGTGVDDWDFFYRGIFFSAYSVDPSAEVYYDHPSYATYYRLMGVGAPDSFQVGSGDDLVVDHIARATVDLWKLGGLLSLAELLVALGIAAAMAIWSIEASPIILAFAAILGALGFTAAYIVETLVEDELGAGWVFYKDAIPGSSVLVKLGMSWWFILVDAGAVIPFPCDGRYIQ